MVFVRVPLRVLFSWRTVYHHKTCCAYDCFVQANCPPEFSTWCPQRCMTRRVSRRICHQKSKWDRKKYAFLFNYQSPYYCVHIHYLICSQMCEIRHLISNLNLTKTTFPKNDRDYQLKWNWPMFKLSMPRDNDFTTFPAKIPRSIVNYLHPVETDYQCFVDHEIGIPLVILCPCCSESLVIICNVWGLHEKNTSKSERGIPYYNI